MKKHFLIALLTVLTAIVGHAANEPIVVDGVVYTYNNGSYVVTGWDEETPIQSLHIIGEFDDGMVEAIANGAFQDNTDIRYLTIDEGIISIGKSSFRGCENLEVAILPEGLVTIDEEAFAYCTALTEFVIPSTVRNIQAQAFMHCTGVTDVYFLMTQASELDEFVWWDGWYQTIDGDYHSSDPHGGIEFKKSRKPYDGDDPRIEHDPINGTRIHIPQGTLSAYNESSKLEAWLLQEDDNCYPLWWIVNYGVVGRTYTVADDLEGIYVDIKEHLYAKDNNRWLTPDKVQPGEIDYMATTGLMQDHDNIYDQSNWVEITGIDGAILPTLNGHVIKGGTLNGELVDKHNPIIALNQDCVPQAGDQTHYDPNVYIAASFMGRTQTTADSERTYAFVRPKPQEYISLKWLIYSESKDAYFIPAPDEDNDINTQELRGGVRANYELYEQPPVPELFDGYIYAFDAINRLNASDTGDERSMIKTPRLKEDISYAPYEDGGISPWFTVYPLSLPEEPITTSVETPQASSTTSPTWYTIDGRNLGVTQPTVPGIYINSGKKVVIK